MEWLDFFNWEKLDWFWLNSFTFAHDLTAGFSFRNDCSFKGESFQESWLCELVTLSRTNKHVNARAQRCRLTRLILETSLDYFFIHVGWDGRNWLSTTQSLIVPSSFFFVKDCKWETINLRSFTHSRTHIVRWIECFLRQSITHKVGNSFVCLFDTESKISLFKDYGSLFRGLG